MNKLVKPILCVSSQMTIAIFMFFLFVFKIYLLVKDFNWVSFSVTLYVAACLLYVVLRIVYNIKTLVKLEKENLFDFRYLAHRVGDLEKLSVKDLEKY